jgi:hypothetical protein
MASFQGYSDDDEMLGSFLTNLGNEWHHLQKAYQGSFLKKILSTAQDAYGLSSLSQYDPSAILNQLPTSAPLPPMHPMVAKKKGGMSPALIIGAVVVIGGIVLLAKKK